MAAGSRRHLHPPRRSLAQLCICLLVTSIGLVRAVPSPQLASSEDADGNTIVYSVTSDALGVLTTSTIETIAAATTSTSTTATTTSTASTSTSTTTTAAATTTSSSVAAPVAAPAVSTSSVVSQDLGQVAASPTSSAPPTTYLVYYTVNGVQTSGYSTFTASFAPTPSPQVPLPGSILDFTAYASTAEPSNKKSGASHNAKITLGSSRGQIAAVGVALSLILGAVAVL